MIIYPEGFKQRVKLLEPNNINLHALINKNSPKAMFLLKKIHEKKIMQIKKENIILSKMEDLYFEAIDIAQKHEDLDAVLVMVGAKDMEDFSDDNEKE